MKAAQENRTCSKIRVLRPPKVLNLTFFRGYNDFPYSLQLLCLKLLAAQAFLALYLGKVKTKGFRG